MRARYAALGALCMLLPAREAAAQSEPATEAFPKVALEPAPVPKAPPEPLPDAGVFVDGLGFAQKYLLQGGVHVRVHPHLVATADACWLTSGGVMANAGSYGVGGMVGLQVFFREPFRGFYLHPRVGFMQFELDYDTLYGRDTGEYRVGREHDSSGAVIAAGTAGYQFRWDMLSLRLGGGLAFSSRSTKVSGDGFVHRTGFDDTSLLLDGALGVVF